MINNMVFVLGFEKCGTSTLHHWLSQHPDICGSIKKEPQFFEREYWLGQDYYLSTYFAHRIDERFLLDSRPRNAVVPYVADRIKESCPNPKFIFTIRDPAQRASSAYDHWKRMRPGREPYSFERAIIDNHLAFCLREGGEPLFTSEEEYLTSLDPAGGTYKRMYIENGLYCRHIKRFEKLFGRESILVVTLDDIARRPHSVCDQITGFIGVNQLADIDLGAKNVAPQRAAESRDLSELREFYKCELDWGYVSELAGYDLKALWGY